MVIEQETGSDHKYILTTIEIFRKRQNLIKEVYGSKWKYDALKINDTISNISRIDISNLDNPGKIETTLGLIYRALDDTLPINRVNKNKVNTNI